MLDGFTVIVLVLDVAVYVLSRQLRHRYPELAFEAVAILAVVCVVSTGIGAFAANLFGATWPVWPGYVLSSLVLLLFVLKTHRPFLRWVSGGRLATEQRFSSIATLGRRYRADVSADLREFIARGWETHDGRFIGELPSYQSDPHSGFLVRFGDLSVADAAREWDVDWEAIPGVIPFAQITSPQGDVEPQFLAVRAQAPNAVVMWEHETGELEPVQESLEAFLADLVAGPTGNTP